MKTRLQKSRPGQRVKLGPLNEAGVLIEADLTRKDSKFLTYRF